MERHMMYHLTLTYIPSIIFVIVAWISFLVPSDVVPGRMVLCVVTLLTLTSMFHSVRYFPIKKTGNAIISNLALNFVSNCVQNSNSFSFLIQDIDTSSLIPEGYRFMGAGLHIFCVLHLGGIRSSTIPNQSKCLAKTS